jgi:hypothetical protein
MVDKEVSMYAGVVTVSHNVNKDSTGKTQSSFGNPLIQRKSDASHPSNRYYYPLPVIEIMIQDNHSVGNGRRGGNFREFATEATVHLDKETLLACIKRALDEGMINLDEISNGKVWPLLEAATRLVKAIELP